MEIIIDNYDFWNLLSMKYWSFPKSCDIKKKREESKYMCLSEKYIGSRKMDGAWNMLIKDMDGNFHLRSRTESVNGGYADKAEWIPHICKELENIPNGTVLLGEIYFPNNEGSRKITSVLNCLKDKCLDRQKKNGWLHFYIFDILAYNGNSIVDLAIETRINNYLYGQFCKIAGDMDYIEVAKYCDGKELWDLYGEVIAKGGEGIVITRKDCSYMPGKRTARMTLKMKKELNETIDAFLDGDYKPATKSYNGKEIESWNYWVNDKTGEKSNICKFKEYSEGEPWEPVTKAYYNGWASAVSFSVMKNGKPEHIAWISGITDFLKQSIVEENNGLVGKVAELTAMEIEHINGEYSLRHGKIVSWREDKTAEECNFTQISDN